MSKADLRVDWATHEAAKYACENWHYSRSVPPPPHVRIGVWESGVFIGVILFARGANKSLVSNYGLRQDEGCELVRVALFKHVAPVSRILSLALSWIKNKEKGLRLIVSFADPEQGHHGGIYQATNWIYAGKSEDSFKWKDKKGREWHPRMVSKKGQKVVFGKIRRVVSQSECVKIHCEGKHRYLMPLDAEMRARVLPLSKPYPKRPKQAEAGPPELRQCDTDPDAPTLKAGADA